MLHPMVWLACRATRRAKAAGETRTIDERRAAEAEASRRRLAPPGDIRITDRTIPIGGVDVGVRIYRPPVAGELPAHLFLHGGSFWSGTLDTSDELCRFYARQAGCVVVSVDYRRAPEHQWPTAAEDGYAALLWVYARAAKLEIDPKRLSVGGVSVGGNLAAVIALMARDRGGPDLVFQLLEIPVLDLTLSCPSISTYGTGYLLTKADLVEGYDLYLPDEAKRVHPYASPLHAEDLTGLPPAFVLTCEYDPLRDEGERYAERLRAAGGRAELLMARGHTHASTYGNSLRSTRRCQQATAGALAAAYARG